MIPYEELCGALARWREKNGLVNGPSATLPQGAILTPPPPAESSGDLVFAASVSSGFGATVPTTEEHFAEPVTTITQSPYEPETIIQDEDDPDAPTGLHLTPEAFSSGHDVTNELEIDDLDSDEPKH